MTISYDWNNIAANALVIDTDTMQFRFKDGAIVYIYNKANSETLLDTDWGTIPGSLFGFIGFNSNDESANNYLRRPSSDHVTWNGTNKTLTYAPCHNEAGNDVTNSSLVYTFSADDASGEITISMTGTEPAATGYIPGSISIPVIDFTGASTIADTAKISRADAAGTFYNSDRGGGRFSPAAFACLGTNSCFGAWSENTAGLADEVVTITHNQNTYDHIVFSWPKDQKVGLSSLVIYGGPVRITTQNAWVDIAKRWRVRFELVFTDAEKLWANANTTIRNIHCAHYGGGVISDAIFDSIVNYFGTLVVNVTRIINAPKVVLFGDVTNVLKPGTANALPTATEISKIQSIRVTYPGAIPYFGYHSWVRYFYNPTTWLTENAAYLPDGYVSPNSDYSSPGSFAPYGGPADPADWLSWWSTYDADYGDSYVSHFTHPGAPNFLSYIILNYPKYCSDYYFTGCFWDILGNDDNLVPSAYSRWPNLVNGYDFISGAVAALKLVYANYPIASEYLIPAIIPYVWWTWAGKDNRGSVTVNHPWYATLVGSYTWAKDSSPVAGYDFTENALMAALPGFLMEGDGGYDSLFGEYFKARALMFCTYKMFNDLPTTWDDGVLAYYRTNTGGNFKFVKRATGRYAYVTEGDVYVLQHELKTGESTGAKTFADTYTSIPTVKVSSGTATNITLTGFDYTVSGTGNWLVFGEQDVTGFRKIYIGGLQCNLTVT